MKKLTKMFSGKPNFSLRNKKLTRRRSISGATSTAIFGTSQAGIFAPTNNDDLKINNTQYVNKNNNKEINSKTMSLEIGRPSSVSSLGPQLTASLPKMKPFGSVKIKIDVSLFLSSPECTPTANDIRGKSEMSLFEVTANTTCGQLISKVIDRVIRLNSANAKRDPNLFYIASVDINNDAKELRKDTVPLTIIYKSTGIISHFKLLIRQGSVIKVYSNSIVPGCEYKTLAIDSKTSCREVTLLVLRAMRVNEPGDRFVLQAFSPSIGFASRRITLDQDDLALAALQNCGFEFSLIIIREHTPGSEPPRRARFSRSRAKLSNEKLRQPESPDSMDIDLETFPSTQHIPSNQSGIYPVGRILIDGPSLTNLQQSDSVISLTGLSFVSVDSNSDSSKNSFDETPCNAKPHIMMLPVPTVGKSVISRTFSSPVNTDKEASERILKNESRATSPSSAEVFLTPDSNMSPLFSHKTIELESNVTNSPLSIIMFPPPPPFNSSTGDSPLETQEPICTSKYNIVSPHDQDSGMGSPPHTSPIQDDTGSRVSYPSDTSLTSTSPSLQYIPGTLLYDLSVSTQPQRNVGNNLSLFSIMKEFECFAVEIVNSGQGLGISLLDPGTGLLIVQSIVKGGVAQKEGSIQQGDRIVEVNNKLVIGESQSSVAGIIRGCIGPIRIVIARGNKLKSSLSPVALTCGVNSDNSEEEIERLNRALKASKPVLSRLRQRNNGLSKQVTDLKRSVRYLTQEQETNLKKLEIFDRDSAALSTAIKGFSQTGKFPLKTELEIPALETTRFEISRFCDEVHTKLTTAKDKLKLAISQGSNYRRQNEQLTNDLKSLQTEFEKEKLNFAKHENMLANIHSSACIDCKVKDQEIASLRTNFDTPTPTNSTMATRQSDKCEECISKDLQFEQLENELTDKMILIADQEAKLHSLRNRK